MRFKTVAALVLLLVLWIVNAYTYTKGLTGDFGYALLGNSMAMLLMALLAILDFDEPQEAPGSSLYYEPDVPKAQGIMSSLTGSKAPGKAKKKFSAHVEDGMREIMIVKRK